MPRIAFPLEDGVILVLETDNRDLYKYTDTNGDGVADKQGSCSMPATAASPTWSGSRAAWPGRSTTGSTPPTTRSGCGSSQTARCARGDRLNGGQWGTNAGQRRQDLVRRRRRRDRPRELPDAHRLRRLQRRRQLRAGFPDAMERARRHRRHAGRHEPRPAARRHAEPFHGGRRPRDLSRPPSARRPGRRSPLQRTRRAHRPPRQGRR